MAAEEDKKFDAVLGGFLLNDLRVRAGDLHCPEPEVLAAYHERSLLPEEMNSWKEHIVGCARCQAVLSELEATDSIPLQVREKEEILRPAAAGSLAAASQGRTVAPAKVPEIRRASRLARGVRWQWLAPAGALAAGLLVWIAWHENQPSQVKAPAEVQVAKVEPPTQAPLVTPQAPAPPVTRQVPAAHSSDQLASLLKDRDAIVATVPAKKSPAPENRKQLGESDSRAKVASAKPSADKEGARQDAGREAIAADQVQSQLAVEGKAAVPPAATQTVEVQAQAPNAPVQNQQTQQNLQDQLSAQKAPGQSPPGHAEQTAKAKSQSPAHALRALAPAAKPAPPQPAAAYDSNVTSYLMARASDLNLIVSPSKKRLWRVGPAGMIGFSGDGGASWMLQSSNVTAALTRGSAPSDKICWIVGRAGTILLTTDAGSHWAVLHSPLDEDLGGVRATDALHATIWNLGNTKVFETSDGGATWRPAVSP